MGDKALECGIATAKVKGNQVGAKPKLTAEQVAEIRHRLAQGAIKAELAREYGISRQTLYSALGATG